MQQFISAFGGDPGQVTLFGESAGAMSVGLHTFAVPGSQNLFANAMMESNPMGEYYLKADATIDQVREMLNDDGLIPG